MMPQKLSNQDERLWTEYSNCVLYEIVYQSKSCELDQCLKLPEYKQIESGKYLCMQAKICSLRQILLRQVEMCPRPSLNDLAIGERIVKVGPEPIKMAANYAP